jgi:hypothetical protein
LVPKPRMFSASYQRYSGCVSPALDSN